MVSISKPGTIMSRSLVMITAILIIAFSCSKSNETDNSNKYCGTISWSTTDGRSGVLTGSTVNGNYRLTDAKFNENGVPGEIILHYDSNGKLINDQAGVIYTYTQNYLSQINIDLQNNSGNGNYNFDSNGHLTSGNVNFTTQGFLGAMTGDYTYDSNDDPVNFSASGTVTTPQGPITLNIQATGDFLTDKINFLPYTPIIAPATSDFSFIPFLSKHLLNKWVISISGTGITTIQLTHQYTYTYDANGNVSTMIKSDEIGNTYSFTYTDCK